MKLKNYLSKNPKKHIIFDFDGVVFSLDWTDPRINEYRNMIRNIGYKYLPNSKREALNSLATGDLANKIIGINDNKAREEIMNIFTTRESLLIPSAQAHLDTIDFIKNNYKEYTYFIWSNNTNKTIINLLDKYDLKPYFDLIIGRDQVILGKPSPEGFDKIFNHKKYIRNDFVMLGDSNFDQKACELAGIDFVYYP